MYHALLTNRYLTTRVIPLIAVAAVALCVALVIIVVSVMTGFLNMVLDSGRTLMGDVVVSYPVNGIPHYDRLIKRLNDLPEVAGASPVVDSWGLLKMPYPEGPRKHTKTVQLWGIEPESFSTVTGFGETLFWRPLTEEEARTAREGDFRRTVTQQDHENGLRLRNQAGEEGIVLGIHVSEANERMSDGSYEPMGLGHWWMPRHAVTLTTLPISTAGGMLDPESVILPVVNEFLSGVFLIDSNRVMVPIGLAQRMLNMDQAEIMDEEGEEVLGIEPARATMVLVRAVEGVTPEELRDLVANEYEAFYASTADEEWVRPPRLAADGLPGARVQTWEEQQAEFIAPIEKERELMRTLFSLVYMVCAGLVLAIFWAIVYEKTRDIGILRSIGASRLGISWIFLRYGLIVGIIGAIAGLGLAFMVIHNINGIHEALGNPPPWLSWILGGVALVSLLATILRSLSGRLLPLVLGSLITLVLALMAGGIFMLHRFGGIVVWDPKVYYFTTIPNEVDMNSAWFTMIFAVIFSVIGAFMPAAKAADTDPVRALRYE